MFFISMSRVKDSKRNLCLKTFHCFLNVLDKPHIGAIIDDVHSTNIKLLLHVFRDVNFSIIHPNGKKILGLQHKKRNASKASI